MLFSWCKLLLATWFGETFDWLRSADSSQFILFIFFQAFFELFLMPFDSIMSIQFFCRVSLIKEINWCPILTTFSENGLVSNGVKFEHDWIVSRSWKSLQYRFSTHFLQLFVHEDEVGVEVLSPPRTFEGEGKLCVVNKSKLLLLCELSLSLSLSLTLYALNRPGSVQWFGGFFIVVSFFKKLKGCWKFAGRPSIGYVSRLGGSFCRFPWPASGYWLGPDGSRICTYVPFCTFCILRSGLSASLRSSRTLCWVLLFQSSCAFFRGSSVSLLWYCTSGTSLPGIPASGW